MNAEGPMSKSDDGGGGSLPILAAELEGVTRMVISPVEGVVPPFPFTRKVELTGDDLAALIAAMGPDQPATRGRPRCWPALSAELFTADGARKGILDMFCAAGTREVEAIILGSVREVSWRFADPDAGMALLERLGS
jgi:hypothetical protein